MIYGSCKLDRIDATAAAAAPALFAASFTSATFLPFKSRRLGFPFFGDDTDKGAILDSNADMVVCSLPAKAFISSLSKALLLLSQLEMLTSSSEDESS